jgi:predicted AAA+ superfamily ATPase
LTLFVKSGRVLSWEIFPFSFREFLDCKNIASEGPLSTKQRLLVQKAFDEYREIGGFPEVAALGRNLRIKTHQEYFHALLFRDLVECHDVSHPKAVSDLAHWLVNNAASLYTVNSLTGYLKSLRHKAPKSAVSDYMEWFEDAYFLFTVRVFDASIARANTNPKKNLLHRPFPDQLRVIGNSCQLRAPSGKHDLYCAATGPPGNPLLQNEKRPGG